MNLHFYGSSTHTFCKQKHLFQSGPSYYPEMSRQIYIDIILPSKFDYCLASDKTSASDGAIIHKSQDLRVESGSNFNDTFFMNNHL